MKERKGPHCRHSRHRHPQPRDDHCTRFRTKGKHSAATVVGTKWLVQDTCPSPLTRVARGKVRATDFAKHETVLVKTGHKYVARARRR